MSFQSIHFGVEGRVATITLDRPERLNAIDDHMPAEIGAAVRLAEEDKAVHVVVVTGSGRAFSSGYDLELYAENPEALFHQSMPWDPMIDYAGMSGNTEHFMSLWRCHKPTIAKVRGYAVAGGSDIALSCDLVVMAEDAKIGYPPARVWGCPTTAMWVYRVGAEQAKRMLFTGDLIDGVEAKRIGLVLDAVPAPELDDRVDELAARIAGIPQNQLMMHKLMVNQAIDSMGLPTTQMLATLFDGMARHSPEGVWFKDRAETIGFAGAIAERDSGDPIPPASQDS
ncbi:MAG: crotonase/enoyl-CoA hydratase family protein [Acidimicrobiia bacterium]|jgi:enoyl-CoA hydratase